MMSKRFDFPMSLGSDNHSAVHPKILDAINTINFGGAHAYGLDEVSKAVQKEFERLFGSRVHAEYVMTGTAANVLALSTLLQSYEAVLCSDESHLHLDECGAIENFAGIKLWPLPSKNGKISPEDAKPFLERRGDQHYSQPRAVSLTQPTETGACYTLQELKAWREFCDRHQLFLHIDGARLANAAVSQRCSLADLTTHIGADVVSFGGTKNGLMGVEAVLFFNEKFHEPFKYRRKQAMQLPSKSRFFAVQFLAYLENDLWHEIASHVVEEAQWLSRALSEFPELSIKFPVDSNAIFVQLPKAWIPELRKNTFFYIWDHRSGLCRWMIGFDWSRAMSEQLLLTITRVRQLCSQKT